ncbi:MAG TPA: hypothetical protein VJ853_07865 [Thermoanaerobaculia bacterium]|nr:hypothetical protein [Thermoanaerobaculia bacterium]
MHVLIFLAQAVFMSQAAGTSRNPEAAPMPMIMMQRGKWMIMLHGVAFVNRTNDSGPRGGGKTFSTNWFMAGASRSLGPGTFGVRTMLSLEPATISGRKYPELFQTGETAFGKQIIDGQHPHDLFMELAAEYLYKNVYVYAAPVGDPALGPVAYPHRASAAELPLAPITHHMLDSTHISFNVITAGTVIGPLTAEASAFHGHEPDENRWNVDGGRIDSWAARVRLQPARNLDFQVSEGRLTHPEAVEPGYQKRTTASASYTFGNWSTTAAWGRVFKQAHGQNLNGYLGETVWKFLSRHYVTARVEIADKDELFPHPVLRQVPNPPQPVRIFRVRAYTVGYTFDVVHNIGVGIDATRYAFPAILNGFYGSHPHSVVVFLRGRLGTAVMHHQM